MSKPMDLSDQRSLEVVDPVAHVDDQGLQRLESVDTLTPGYYWRCTRQLKVEREDWPGHFQQLLQGDVHLLLDVFDFEGTPHSVSLLCHPREGSDSEHRILIAEFLAHFEPAADGDLVRAREQEAVMSEVAELQQTMLAAQDNPLALPAVQEAVAEAVERFQRESVAEVQRQEADQRKRTQDLDRIYRRAARRSAAAGNPLAVRSTTISDNVEMMLKGGIDSEGLKDLTVEAKRRQVMAKATSEWLTQRTRDVARKMESLAPYYAEKGRVALARASKTIKYVKSLQQGLSSLKLYTGDGVDVLTIAEGAHAAPGEPLTLVQGKKFADEEFAVWADVSDSFDWSSVPEFFKSLKANRRLLEQVFPTPRCVVAMAATRRDIVYPQGMGALEAALNAIQNKRVFLLVRNGDHVHAVYSSEPSHESVPRLFPSKAEVDKVFTGLDGSRIGLHDVAFAKAADQHELLRICYLRLLVLLCGLDHRMKLFGDFYPATEGLSFMRQEFQQRYFRFLADDEHEALLGDDLAPVREWIARCNAAVQSGSRIVALQAGLSAYSPMLNRMNSMMVDTDALMPVLIAGRKGKDHFVTVPVKDRYQRGGEAFTSAVVWLNGSEAKNADWYLCIDRVSVDSLKRYIYSRRSRAADISWLRAFKKAEAVLLADFHAQADLAEHLRQTALQHGVCDDSMVDEAVAQAIATWRAAHRGAPAPQVDDVKGVNGLLSLIFPADRLVENASSELDVLIEQLGQQPLQLVRTGKNKLALYAEASDTDRQPYAEGVGFGWVKRIAIESVRGKLKAGASKLVWLEECRPDASEEVLRTWPQRAAWVHKHPEPCRLEDLEHMKEAMAQAETWGPMLREGRARLCAGALPQEVHEDLMLRAASLYRKMNFFDTVWVAIPLGLGQYSQDKEAHFLYAVMSYPGFVRRYGGEAQWNAFCEHPSLLARFGSGRLVAKARAGEADGARWILRSTRQPLKGPVVGPEPGLQTPTLVGHRSGQKGHGGDFTATLSFNRALDRYKGRDPYGRRSFYRDVKDRIWREIGLGWEEGSDEKRKAELNRRWQPAYPNWNLSALAWDERRGRSIGNGYFAVTLPKDDRQ